MKRYMLLIKLLLISLFVSAQLNKDSILTNERTIDRPITLHKGQLQTKTAYEISILSKNYDIEGKPLDIASQGTASVLHKYFFEFNYGILDLLQASIAINYSKRGERKENRFVYGLDTQPYLDISYLDDYKGFDDIYIGVLFKLPLKTNKIELALSHGMFLPIFSNEPKEPEHKIILASAAQDYTKINYHYHHKFANGAMAFKFGAISKFRVNNNLSIEAQINYTAPLSESKSITWTHQLLGNSFDYEKTPYNYLISNKLYYNIILAYQAISWLNISSSYSSVNYFDGWTEETGLRIGNLERKLNIFLLGYEIKITSKLLVNQIFKIPISGKNQLAPISFFTGISYNLFPFNK